MKIIAVTSPRFEALDVELARASDQPAVLAVDASARTWIEEKGVTTADDAELSARLAAVLRSRGRGGEFAADSGSPPVGTNALRCRVLEPSLLATVRESSDWLGDERAVYQAALLSTRSRATVVGSFFIEGAESEALLSVIAVPISLERGALVLIYEGAVALTPELRALVTELALLLGESGQIHAELERLRGELAEARTEPAYDSDLGVWNEPGLFHMAEMRLAEAKRYHARVPFAVIDVCNLNAINAQHGHAAGDEVLRHVSRMLAAALRTQDIIGKYGNGNFAMILPGAGALGSERAMERALERLTAHPLVLASGQTLALGFTYGIAESDPDSIHAEEALTQAALAVTAAKDSGEKGHVAKQQAALRFLGNPEAGSVIAGTYKLRYKISRGAVGAVYRADDIRLGRSVAIKMLHSELDDDPTIVDLFTSEASILASLRHPNLVEVYTSGIADGIRYFVMELVEGESIQSNINRLIDLSGSIPLAKVCRTLRQVGSALDALHAKGIMHCDVKPDNIIVDPFQDRAVLVDVGVARRHGDKVLPAGTPGYMAPEIYTGAPSSIAADVYGLAATAFAMLALRDPWSRSLPVPELISKQCTSPAPHLSEVRPEFAAFDDLLTASLSARPEDRASSAGAFVEEFESIADNMLGGSARPASRPAPPPTDQADVARQSRGLVFRALPRVLGARTTKRLEGILVESQPDLAAILSGTTIPLGWFPTALLIRLLSEPSIADLREDLPRHLGRATVRSSFQRLFPASSATLSPHQTLMSIESIWSSYQSWGTITPLPQRRDQVTVRLEGTPRQPLLCEWTRGLLEQLVLLSRGRSPTVTHEQCEARGDNACLFEVKWIDDNAALLPANGLVEQ